MLDSEAAQVDHWFVTVIAESVRLRQWRNLGPWLLAGFAMVLAAAALGIALTRGGSARPLSTNCLPYASPGCPALSGVDRAPVSWSSEGSRLLAVTNTRFAYRSTPIDIRHDGTYLIEFGPVASWFNFPKTPQGLSPEYPSNAHFLTGPVGTSVGVPQIVKIDGQRYLRWAISVQHLRRPYIGFYGWLYSATAPR